MHITDGRIGSAVAGGTIGTGTATWADWIPGDIGKIATLVGIILSLVLIAVHLRKMRYDAKEWELKQIKAQLEIDELRTRMEKPAQ